MSVRPANTSLSIHSLAHNISCHVSSVSKYIWNTCICFNACCYGYQVYGNDNPMLTTGAQTVLFLILAIVTYFDPDLRDFDIRKLSIDIVSDWIIAQGFHPENRSEPQTDQSRICLVHFYTKAKAMTYLMCAWYYSVSCVLCVAHAFTHLNT